ELDLAPALDDLDLELLAAQLLARDRLLDLVGEVGLRARAHVLGLEDGLLDLVVAARLLDRQVGLVAGGARLALGLGLAADRVALDLGGARAAERLEVALLVGDVADG